MKEGMSSDLALPFSSEQNEEPEVVKSVLDQLCARKDWKASNDEQTKKRRADLPSYFTVMKTSC